MDVLIGMMLGRTMAQMFASRRAEIGGPLLEVSELSGREWPERPLYSGGERFLNSGLAGSGRTECCAS